MQSCTPAVARIVHFRTGPARRARAAELAGRRPHGGVDHSLGPLADRREPSSPAVHSIRPARTSCWNRRERTVRTAVQPTAHNTGWTGRNPVNIIAAASPSRSRVAARQLAPLRPRPSGGLQEWDMRMPCQRTLWRAADLVIAPPTLAEFVAQVDHDPAARWVTTWPPPKSRAALVRGACTTEQPGRTRRPTTRPRATCVAARRRGFRRTS